MITPKPLSKEQREKLWEPHETGALIDALIAAEAYWREAVKNTEIVDEISINGEYCPFCKQGGWQEFSHQPDCPWLLAQET